MNKDLLSILVCPSCQGQLNEKDDKVVCTLCSRQYPIQDDMPVLLVDQAEQIKKMQ